MKTLFIIGCPRSGTTYLLRLLAANQSFGWVSGKLNKTPEKLDLASELKGYNNSILGYKRYRKWSSSGKGPNPVEPWVFWNHYYDYFQWKPKAFPVAQNAMPEDNSEQSIKAAREAVGQILKNSGKVYFLSKYTDFPRIQLIKESFPDAKFVHLVRDGRAVANSYKEKVVSGKFNTSKEEDSWVNSWPKDWQEKYNSIENNKSYAFTLFQWKFFVDEINNALSKLPETDFIEVKYSDLVKNTPKEAQKILDFAGLKMDRSMRYFLKNLPGINQNYKWQEELTSEEKAIIEDVITEKRFLDILDK